MMNSSSKNSQITTLKQTILGLRQQLRTEQKQLMAAQQLLLEANEQLLTHEMNAMETQVSDDEDQKHQAPTETSGAVQIPFPEVVNSANENLVGVLFAATQRAVKRLEEKPTSKLYMTLGRAMANVASSKAHIDTIEKAFGVYGIGPYITKQLAPHFGLKPKTVMNRIYKSQRKQAQVRKGFAPRHAAGYCKCCAQYEDEVWVAANGWCGNCKRQGNLCHQTIHSDEFDDYF